MHLKFTAITFIGLRKPDKQMSTPLKKRSNCIGSIFQKVHINDRNEEIERAKLRCIQQSKYYMKNYLADEDTIGRELFITYYSNLFDKALRTPATNKKF